MALAGAALFQVMNVFKVGKVASYCPRAWKTYSKKLRGLRKTRRILLLALKNPFFALKNGFGAKKGPFFFSLMRAKKIWRRAKKKQNPTRVNRMKIWGFLPCQGRGQSGAPPPTRRALAAGTAWAGLCLTHHHEASSEAPAAQRP